MSDPTAPVTGIPAITSAQAQLLTARMLVHGMLHAREPGSLSHARGLLLRAAVELEQTARTGHMFAAAYDDGAAQARRAARLLGQAAVRLRSGIEGELTPGDQDVIAAVMRLLQRAVPHASNAYMQAYAGTHP